MSTLIVRISPLVELYRMVRKFECGTRVHLQKLELGLDNTSYCYLFLSQELRSIVHNSWFSSSSNEQFLRFAWCSSTSSKIANTSPMSSNSTFSNLSNVKMKVKQGGARHSGSAKAGFASPLLWRSSKAACWWWYTVLPGESSYRNMAYVWLGWTLNKSRDCTKEDVTTYFGPVVSQNEPRLHGVWRPEAYSKGWELVDEFTRSLMCLLEESDHSGYGKRFGLWA
jgi:hypothetical protein